MTEEKKHKLKVFESNSLTSMENMYMEWRQEKGDTISDVVPQFGCEGATYHIAVFFSKEDE